MDQVILSVSAVACEGVRSVGAYRMWHDMCNSYDGQQLLYYASVFAIVIFAGAIFSVLIRLVVKTTPPVSAAAPSDHSASSDGRNRLQGTTPTYRPHPDRMVGRLEIGHSVFHSSLGSGVVESVDDQDQGTVIVKFSKDFYPMNVAYLRRDP